MASNPALSLRHIEIRDDGKNMRIESKAPTRVDLAGGTLDIWPLYLFHPGAVTINAAITRYASCVIETHAVGDQKVRLVSRDTKREESFTSFAAMLRVRKYQLPLLAEIAKFFRPESGFTLTRIPKRRLAPGS